MSARNSKHWLTVRALRDGYKEQRAYVLLPSPDVAVVELYWRPSSGDVDMFVVDRKVKQHMTDALVSSEHHVFTRLADARRAFGKLSKGENL